MLFRSLVVHAARANSGMPSTSVERARLLLVEEFDSGFPISDPFAFAAGFVGLDFKSSSSSLVPVVLLDSPLLIALLMSDAAARYLALGLDAASASSSTPETLSPARDTRLLSVFMRRLSRVEIDRTP